MVACTSGIVDAARFVLDSLNSILDLDTLPQPKRMKRPRCINMCPGCGFDFGHCTDAGDLHIRASTRLVADFPEAQPQNIACLGIGCFKILRVFTKNRRRAGKGRCHN